MINVKTNACIMTDRIPRRYTIIGTHTGKLNHKKPIVAAHNHNIATFNKIDHADIFPKSLNAREIILAKNPIISSNPVNNETTISTHLLSANHFQVIGMYSWSNCKLHPTVLRCTYKITRDHVRAIATLNSNSPVQAVIFLNKNGKKNLNKSFIYHIEFAIKSKKNIDTQNFTIRVGFSLPIIHSKKS